MGKSFDLFASCCPRMQWDFGFKCSKLSFPCSDLSISSNVGALPLFLFYHFCGSPSCNVLSLIISSILFIFRKIVLSLLLSSLWLENSQMQYTLQFLLWDQAVTSSVEVHLALCSCLSSSFLALTPLPPTHSPGVHVLIKSFAHESLFQSLFILWTQPKI